MKLDKAWGFLALLFALEACVWWTLALLLIAAGRS